MKNADVGTIQTVTVFAEKDGYAAFPCLMRTDRDLILEFMYQPLGPLRATKLHPHYAPVMTRKSAVSGDGGLTWSVADQPYPLRSPLVETTRGDYYGAVVLADHSLYTITLLHKPGTTDQYSLSHRLRRTPSGAVVWEAPLTETGPLENYNPFSIVRLSDDTLLAAGYWYETGHTQMSVVVLRSADGGRSWTHHAKIDSPDVFGVGEPGLVVLKDGRIIMSLRAEWSCVKNLDPAEWPEDVNGHGKKRDGYGYYLYQSESVDNGLTWTVPHPLPLWGHPGFMVQLQSGKVLLVYGHRRSPFSIRAVLSHDGCRSWDLATLKTLHTFDPGGYDIGYPVALQGDDGRIHCAFYGYSTDQVGEYAPHGIFMSTFDEAWLMRPGDARSETAGGAGAGSFDAKAVGLIG